MPLCAVAVTLSGAVTLVGVSVVNAGATPFTSGDLVVAVEQQSASGNLVDAVNLVDYSTSGTPSGSSAQLPTAAAGNNQPIVDYGGYANGGLLTDSGDGGNLVYAGYEPRRGDGPRWRRALRYQPRLARCRRGHRRQHRRNGRFEHVPERRHRGAEYKHYDRSATMASSGASAAGGGVYLSGSQAIDELTQGAEQTTDNFLEAGLRDNVRPADPRGEAVRLRLGVVGDGLCERWNLGGR